MRGTEESCKEKKPKLFKFTLIELLIVVAIIAVLVSLIQPALKKAIINANRIVCINNLKQWYTCTFLYTDDYNDAYPFGGNRNMIFIKRKTFLDLNSYGLPGDFGCTSYDDKIKENWKVNHLDESKGKMTKGVIYWGNRKNSPKYTYAKKINMIDQATSDTLLTCFARRAYGSLFDVGNNYIPHLDGDYFAQRDILPPDPEGLAVALFDGSCLFTPYEDLTLNAQVSAAADFWFKER